ncbi:MAG: hypothetical protein IBX69_05170, partial [Anaerolineales bacterium]|nr:hypothetical protein [Anaerolineales bacterium]
PPPGAQPGTQPTVPYPAPVTPTSDGLSPAYPPPGEQPVSTQTPDDFPTVDPLSTPALVPLPMEFLTLEFPSGFGGEVTELPAGSQEAALDEERSDTNMQTVLLVLIGMLWMILGGWVYLIARYWLIF